MSKIKILVATHKKFNCPKEEIYMPIHAGKEGKEELGYIGDDTGENISNKNPNFCELTVMYWAWKNMKEYKYIGLNHYRRYFIKKTINNTLKYIIKNISVFFKLLVKNKLHLIGVQKDINEEFLEEYVNKNLTENIKKDLEKYDVILPRRYKFTLPVKSQYIMQHVREDLIIMEEVLKEKTPEYFKSYKKVMKGNKISLCNMFITKKEIYEEYCEWLFGILFEVEKRVKVSGYPLFSAK